MNQKNKPIELSDATAATNRYKLLLAPLSIAGFLLVLLSTSRWGAGLSPDSVGYISVARELIKGKGLIVRSFGSPLVDWPPLYPTLLALVSSIVRTDPLTMAPFLNALIFGLVIFLGGLLALRSLLFFPTLAVLGTLAIVFSVALFPVSIMAWSEPLFISFVLLSLLVAQSYLEESKISLLLLLAVVVSLATLTRYIGVVLILWGVLLILLFLRSNLKKKVAHLSLFILVSAVPLGLWLLRNYAISNTLTGSRFPSSYTILQNLTSTLETLLFWMIPKRFIGPPLLYGFILVIGAALLFFISIRARISWPPLNARAQPISPIFLFAVLYPTFLVISSTIAAYDEINNRLLSPIFVPVTLLSLTIAPALLGLLQERFSRKTLNLFMVIITAIWLAYLMASTLNHALDIYAVGRGYSSREWANSETVEYLLQNPTLVSGCPTYSNNPDATYILADIATSLSPAAKGYNAPDTTRKAISDLKGVWPEEKSACLIWFDQVGRDFLYTVDELQEIVHLEVIAQLEDGTVYSVTRE